MAPTCAVEGARVIRMRFLEGERLVTEDQLRAHDITRYQVTKFYTNQIRASGYYDQLQHIVEPSTREFTSEGTLDTSGEHDHTVVHGLQHKYRRRATRSSRAAMP